MHLKIILANFRTALASDHILVLIIQYSKISVFSKILNQAPIEEKCIFALFFLSAQLCLFFSTLFHTLGCHSSRILHIFGKFTVQKIFGQFWSKGGKWTRVVGDQILNSGSPLSFPYFNFLKH